MQFRLGAVCLILCSILIGCGGGGSGTASSPGVRAVSLTFHPGTPLSYTDAVSGLSVNISSSSLSKSGAVVLEFSKMWSVSPQSPQAKRIIHVAIETDDPLAAESVTVSAPFTGTNLANAQFVTQNSDLTWHTIQTIRANGVANALVPDPTYRTARTRGGKHKIHFDLSDVPYSADFSEKTVDIVLLNGEGDPSMMSQPGSVLLVHGMNNNVYDLSALANRLVISKQFKAVYALKYPWPKDIKQNAAEFAKLLPTRLAKGTKVPIIAHSMGGLVVSYAIERLKMSDYVSQFVMVATPRQGAAQATLTDLCRVRADSNLSDPSDTPDHWANLCDLSTISMSQIRPGSAFMKELNGSPTNHRNYVPYQLIAGTKPYVGSGILCADVCDGLVEKHDFLDFQYAENVTLGAVNQYAIPYNHSSIINDSGALDTIQSAITTGASKLGPQIGAVPDNNGIATDTGWDIAFSLTNTTSAFDMIASYFVLQIFDRNGDWITTQWYDPSVFGGAFLPENPYLWDYVLSQKAVFNVTPHLSFDKERHNYANAAYASRALSIVCICSGRLAQTGDPFTIVHNFVVKDKNGLGPLSPPRYETVRSVSDHGAFSAR